MQISDFNMPTERAWNMLNGYQHASEKEDTLSFILKKCIEAGDFVAVGTVHNHPTMVEDGLLEKVEDYKYKLTKKSIGLLYSVYGKELK